MICAEGYVFELERRGYLQAGAFVPEVVLEHPEVVRQLHRDLVHAGSDVVEALTYYAHRDKLRVVGREGDLEALNRQALAIAKEVADESGALCAGDISNTNIFADDDATAATVRAHVRGAGRLGGRGGRRLRHRRDALVGQRGADRARDDQGRRPARGRHACRASGIHDVRGLADPGDVQAARSGRRGRRRPQLHPRPPHDAPAAARDPRSRRLPRRGRARALPDDGGGADLLRRSTTPRMQACRAAGTSRPRSSR